MVSECPLKMLSEMGMRTMLGSNDGSYGDDLGKELELLLQEQRRQEARDHERELNIYRSGSAPPTVEGSLTAVGSLFGHGSDDGSTDFSGSKNSSNNGFLSEEDLRSDPAYLSYYYANVKLNPRLPPPVLSKEDMRFAQRLQAGGPGFGGIGDMRKVNRVEDGATRSLFSLQPGFSSQKEEAEIESRKPEKLSEWLERGGDGLIGLSGLGLVGRQKSFADILQVYHGAFVATISVCYSISEFSVCPISIRRNQEDCLRPFLGQVGHGPWRLSQWIKTFQPFEWRFLSLFCLFIDLGTWMLAG